MTHTKTPKQSGNKNNKNNIKQCRQKTRIYSKNFSKINCNPTNLLYDHKVLPKTVYWKVLKNVV